MNNIALIFAGGVGARMNTKAKPKQFLDLHGKPFIVYTIEHFQNHADIDAIVVVMHPDWLGYMEELIKRYQLSKVVEVIAGGTTGQLSIFNGLECAKKHFSANSTEIGRASCRERV